MMLPKMRSEFFAHELSNIVFVRKLRADMDVSGPFATGAAIAGLWIPAQGRNGIHHRGQGWHIWGWKASQFLP